MRGTSVAKAGIAIALSWIALVACETKLPVTARASGSPLQLLPDYQLSGGRVCQVNGEDCLSMTPDAAHPCLASSERCPMNGSFQSVELDHADSH
jgi:hypothetical protein